MVILRAVVCFILSVSVILSITFITMSVGQMAEAPLYNVPPVISDSPLVVYQIIKIF